MVVIDNLSSGNLDNIAQLSGKIEVVEDDVSDGLNRIEGPFDAVIHLAALISGRDSLVEPDLYFDRNIRGLLRVVEFVAAHSVPRIIFASSSTVYGNNQAPTLSERDMPSPLSVYASTKLSGEHLLAMYGAMHGFSHCSLRFFNVYGPRQAIDHPYANVTCKFSHAAAKGLPIKLYGDGEQSRDFVYVDDVVGSLLLVLSGSKSVVYNIGTGVQTSIMRLISSLEDISGRRLEIDRQDEWPNDIRRISADLSLAESEIGYSANVGIADGLARTVAFFRSL